MKTETKIQLIGCALCGVAGYISITDPIFGLIILGIGMYVVCEV